MREAFRSSSARSMSVPDPPQFDGADSETGEAPVNPLESFRFSEECVTPRVSIDGNASDSGLRPTTPRLAQLEHCNGHTSQSVPGFRDV